MSTRQRSLNIDVNDLQIFSRGNSMNLNSEYNQHIPMFFTREGSEINLDGQYKGASIFFIGNGPSFVKLNREFLSLPGVTTFGINNGAKTFRPNFWASVDEPDRFLKSIWLDPKITKFIPYGNFEKFIFDNENWQPTNIRAGTCPNVIGYRRNEKFVASRFLKESHFNWGNSKENGGCRSVMLPALRIMYILGFRKVYLLGVDLAMSQNYTYHFDEQRANSAIQNNNNTYDRLMGEYLPQLKPYFDQEGFQVFNCNPNSNLKVFPFVSYEDAIKEATSKLGDVTNERVWGLYAKPEERMQWKQEASIEQKPHLETLKKLERGEVIAVQKPQPKAPKQQQIIPTPQMFTNPRILATTPQIPQQVPTMPPRPQPMPSRTPVMPLNQHVVQIPSRPPPPRQPIKPTPPPPVPQLNNNTLIAEYNKAQGLANKRLEQDVTVINPKPQAIPKVPPMNFFRPKCNDEAISPNLMR